MSKILSDADLDTIFRDARSHGKWSDKPVSEITLEAIYDLMRWGPTSANCCPARILFLRSQEAKERLRPALPPQNVEKSMTAPVVAVIGYDMQFFDYIPQLMPRAPEMADRFRNNQALADVTAFRNGTLQGAYFIIAARALGLDCGPMSGFNNAVVDEEFWPDGRVKSNFLCNLGYGDTAALLSRSPRLSFDESCDIL